MEGQLHETGLDDSWRVQLHETGLDDSWRETGLDDSWRGSYMRQD